MTKKLNKTLLAASLIVGGAFAVPALAQSSTQPGFYGGASLGQSHSKDDINGVDSDGSNLSGKAYGGYRFNQNFSIEGGGMSLGKFDNNSGDAKAYGAFVDGVGTLPLNDRFSLLGRVGVAHARVKTSNGDDDGTGLKVGAGVQYNLTPTTSIRGEWERYRLDVFDSKPNIDQYTVGVNFGF